MAISLEQLRKKMVPDSSKKGSSIDNQWLEPASYDKNAKEKMIGSDAGDVYDQEDHEAENFKAQDTVKKNTKAPLREMSDAPTETSASNDSAVNQLYEEESIDLIDDILDMMESDTFGVHDYCWKEVTQHLKAARDVLVRANIHESEQFIEESFKVGSLKLHDGSSVKLTKEDVKSLNVAVAGTTNKAKLLDEITRSKKEFHDFLTFSKNLEEDFNIAIDNLLDEATDEQLEHIASNRLSEGEVWRHIKGGTIAGAHVGKNIGAGIGFVGGGAYGGAIGAGVGITRTVARAVNNKRKQQQAKMDEHDALEKSLGVANPATDSSPNSPIIPKKKMNEELGSNATAKDYIDDFEKSKNSRFEGDSKAKRRQRAIAAYMGAKDKK